MHFTFFAIVAILYNVNGEGKKKGNKMGLKNGMVMMDWITVADAAKIIGYSDRRSVNYLLERGAVPEGAWQRLGRMYYVSKAWAKKYKKPLRGRPKKASA